MLQDCKSSQDSQGFLVNVLTSADLSKTKSPIILSEKYGFSIIKKNVFPAEILQSHILKYHRLTFKIYNYGIIKIN
jgi:hypothetical protein